MKSLKKFLAVLLVACSVCSVLNVAVPTSKVYAAEKPAQVEGLVVTRTAKVAVKLAWSPVYNVKGYEVSMKTGKKGTFKKVKSTKGTSATIKNLKIGQTYYFKVRAYVSNRGKKLYGKYSVVSKNKLENWVYLTDVLEPYAGEDYSVFKNNDITRSFKMGGKDYSSGFTAGTYWHHERILDIYFNLAGKYSSISFEWGAVDGEDDGDTTTVQIYADDILVDELSRNKGDLPKTYSLNVRDVYKLRFVKSEDFTAGFGNVKLYF